MLTMFYIYILRSKTNLLLLFSLNMAARAFFPLLGSGIISSSSARRNRKTTKSQLTLHTEKRMPFLVRIPSLRVDWTCRFRQWWTLFFGLSSRQQEVTNENTHPRIIYSWGKLDWIVPKQCTGRAIHHWLKHDTVKELDKMVSSAEIPR